MDRLSRNEKQHDTNQSLFSSNAKEFLMIFLSFSESWPTMDALWKPLYTPPTIADGSMFHSEHNQAPLWGSLGSVWSSSTWSPGPGPVAPPITTTVPILNPTQQLMETQEEDGGSPTMTVSEFNFLSK